MIAGAVLCGGASRRMGADKALVVIDGALLAERVAAVLEAAGCSPVVFVGGDATALAATGRPYVADRWPGAGPVGGVLTALESFAGSGVDGVVVTACDLVSLTPEAVRVLLAGAVRPGSAPVAAMAHTGRLEPMLGYWPLADRPRVAARFPGVSALHELADQLGVLPVAVPAEALRNANRPADLPPGARQPRGGAGTTPSFRGATG